MKSRIEIKKTKKDVYELPDGSIAYTMKKAISEYKKIKPVKYTVSDLILIILYSQDKPLRGKTLFHKEVFYFEKEIFHDIELEDCKFVPYYYGPYSFYVSNTLKNLVSDKLVIKTKQSGTGKTQYTLSKKGKLLINKKFHHLPLSVQYRIEKLRKGLDQFGIKILNLIYKDEKYQKYIVKSRISHRYKLITWG